MPPQKLRSPQALAPLGNPQVQVIQNQTGRGDLLNERIDSDT